MTSCLYCPVHCPEEWSALEAPHGLKHYGNPNSNGRSMRQLWGALLHHTGSPDTGSWVDEYCARNPRLRKGLSYHSTVHADGRIVLLPKNPYDVAWHAGKSMYASRAIRRMKKGWTPKPPSVLNAEGKPYSPANKRGGMNYITVGIAVCTTGPITEAQLESTIWLAACVVREVNEREGTPDCRNRVIAHWEYTARKIDPRLTRNDMNKIRSRIRNLARDKRVPYWHELWDTT